MRGDLSIHIRALSGRMRTLMRTGLARNWLSRRWGGVASSLSRGKIDAPIIRTRNFDR